MKLYEFGPTRSIRVRWTLQEMGLPFESVPVNLRAGEHRQPEFLKLNPAGKLPVLEDDGFILNESGAILLYLAEKYADKGLYANNLKERADLDRWMFFTATEIEQPLWRAARHDFAYPEEKRNPKEKELAHGDFQPMAAVLENHLKTHAFLLGDRVSVADFMLAYTLDWATMYGWLTDFPTLTKYVEKMFARPAAPPRMAVAFAKQ